ncbi:MAG: 50S ribosomal protein L25/general stress protein Ctc [Gammaproteobacteria bacterium]|nr:50S ribosomal protein L25/general stress protein Ctc [Gammaproteobacteria bacterium]
MAEQIVINAELRTDLGKGASRRLRRLAGKVPGIIYGAGEDPVSLTMEYRELAKAMQDEAFFSQIVSVSTDGSAEQAVVRDLQRHPATEKVLHVDFLRIRADRAIQVRVPLRFLNEESCIGILSGEGAIVHNLNDLEISCLPAYLPQNIEVDMQNVDLGDTIHLSDLVLPEGVTIPALALGDERNITVASVQLPRGGLEDELEEEGEEDLEGIEGAEGEEGDAEDSAEASGESEGDDT